MNVWLAAGYWLTRYATRAPVREVRPSSKAARRAALHPPAYGSHPARTREPFLFPFARGVDSHLRPVIRQAAGVVERIHRPQHELNVALRIDVVQRLPRHFAHVLHVDVLIHHHDALAEHRLPESPDGVHHL